MLSPLPHLADCGLPDMEFVWPDVNEETPKKRKKMLAELADEDEADADGAAETATITSLNEQGRQCVRHMQ